MRKMLILLVVAAPLMAQEGFDFKTLDKLGANSKNKTNITLDGDMLKLAAGFLGTGTEIDSLKPLIHSLKGISIRSFGFDKEDQYNEADLEPFRTYLKQGNWNRIVEAREGKGYSEIYLQPLSERRLGGVAIISAEAKEVTIVYISGNLNQEDLAKLSGTMGIPDIKMQLKGKKAGDAAAGGESRSGKGKKDDEE